MDHLEKQKVMDKVREGMSPIALLPLRERRRSLALIYLSLTISTRSLFLPDRILGKEKQILSALRGLNEIHHALANQLASEESDEEGSCSIGGLCSRLLDIAGQFGLQEFLQTAIEYSKSRKSP